MTTQEIDTDPVAHELARLRALLFNIDFVQPGRPGVYHWMMGTEPLYTVETWYSHGECRVEYRTSSGYRDLYKGTDPTQFVLEHLECLRENYPASFNRYSDREYDT